MGWTGIYRRNIKSIADRRSVLLEELNQEDRVLDISNKGNTFYIAYKQNDNSVCALVVLTEKNKDEFLYKVMGESCMPYKFDCPKRILNLLTPTDNEYSNQWRKECLK